MNELTKDFIYRLQAAVPSAFFTGSYAYAADNSSAQDIDIVVPFEFRSQYTYFRDNAFLTKSQPYVDVVTGSYFVSEVLTHLNFDLPINVIFVTAIDWHCWAQATKLMQNLPGVMSLDKIHRHAVFESLRAIVKSTLDVNHTMSGSLPQ